MANATSSSIPAVDENSLFVDILHEAPLSSHREPRSIFGSILYCILLAGCVVVAAAAPWIFFLMPKLIPAMLCSCNVILLVITGIFQQYLVYQVKKVRLQGYYMFSEKLKHIARLPFATTAYGTALMLLILVWQPHLQILSVSTLLRVSNVLDGHVTPKWNSDRLSMVIRTNSDKRLTPDLVDSVALINLGPKMESAQIRIVMFAEVIGAGCFMSVYIGCINQYNSLNGQPDILKSLYSALQPSSSLEDLRYHDGGRLSDQQMALLQYQRENLHYLSEEVLRLQELLSKYQRADDGNTPQVDLAHLLAARDQELRALSAEMNHVHAELHLARNLIAERDNEIQQIRLTNNKYVEENERLRAILGEWSSRAAKLERALEAERLSTLELQKRISEQRSQSSSQVGDVR